MCCDCSFGHWQPIFGPFHSLFLFHTHSHTISWLHTKRTVDISFFFDCQWNSWSKIWNITFSFLFGSRLFLSNPKMQYWENRCYCKTVPNLVVFTNNSQKMRNDNKSISYWFQKTFSGLSERFCYLGILIFGIIYTIAPFLTFPFLSADLLAGHFLKQFIFFGFVFSVDVFNICFWLLYACVFFF